MSDILPTAERINILLVDDRPENLLALKSILQTPLVQAHTATSGPAALKLVLKHEFAVILLDVRMPGMDGFETARLIREREASRHIPILFLTAVEAEAPLVYRGYSSGAADYLVKPIDPAVVRAKVAVFVDLHLKTRQIRRQQEQLRALERLRSDQALKESEALYELTFDHAAVGIAHVSTEGQWLRVNPRFRQMVGFADGETLQTGFQELIHPDEREELLLALRRILLGKLDVYRADHRGVHRHGHSLWVNLTVSLLRNAGGQPRYFIAVVSDITDRRRAEETQRFLASASERLLGTLDFSTTLARLVELAVPALGEAGAAWATTGAPGAPEETPLTCTAGPGAEALALLADQPRDPLGLRTVTVIDVRGGGLRENLHLDPELAARVEQSGHASLLLVPLVAAERWLGTLVLGSTREGSYGPTEVAVATDLAARAALALENARLYRDARDAVAARDEFLSIASHELRTPLAPLQIQLQWLIGSRNRNFLDEVSRDDLRRVLRRADRQVQRLCRLVDELLDVTRITAGRLKLEVEAVDLAAIARDVAARSGELLQRAGSSLTLSCDTPVTGHWDPLRLEQVVTNLLTNAIKYGEGRPVIMEVEASADRARLSVTDHGIGIAPDKIRRIFDRFERGAPDGYGGLGLGLYIVRQIVEGHGGTVSVTSQDGQGSTFTVELPVATGLVPSIDQTPTPEPASPEYPHGEHEHACL